MVNHRTLKDIQRWSVGHIKNDFEVTSYTFVKLIVLIILYYDNKGQIYLFLIFYLLSHIPFSLPYLLFLTSDPLSFIPFPLSLITLCISLIPYPISNIPHLISHTSLIPYPLYLLAFALSFTPLPIIPYPICPYCISHIPYPISYIPYPTSLIHLQIHTRLNKANREFICLFVYLFVCLSVNFYFFELLTQLKKIIMILKLISRL